MEEDGGQEKGGRWLRKWRRIGCWPAAIKYQQTWTSPINYQHDREHTSPTLRRADEKFEFSLKKKDQKENRWRGSRWLSSPVTSDRSHSLDREDADWDLGIQQQTRFFPSLKSCRNPVSPNSHPPPPWTIHPLKPKPGLSEKWKILFGRNKTLAVSTRLVGRQFHTPQRHPYGCICSTSMEGIVLSNPDV